MIVKYKVSDFAKDLNLSAKKVLDELNAMGSTGKKNSSNLEENELNYLLEKFSKDNSVANLDEFLNSAKAAKEEPKPTEKKAEKKAESAPAPAPAAPASPSTRAKVAPSSPMPCAWPAWWPAPWGLFAKWPYMISAICNIRSFTLRVL